MMKLLILKMINNHPNPLLLNKWIDKIGVLEEDR